MTVFLATIKNGHINLSEHNGLRFLDWAKQNEGKIVRIEVPKKKRSTSQNAYYWLYMNVISADTGDDPVSLHEFFKRTLLPPKYITVLKKEIKVPQSTTELSKTEMGEYLERICAMTGIPLPDPELAGYYVEK